MEEPLDDPPRTQYPQISLGQFSPDSSSPTRVNFRFRHASRSQSQRFPFVSKSKHRITKRIGRRGPATLEQRRQVRYLASHTILNTNQIIEIVGCAYSAVRKILNNTYGGGDNDLGALPRDKAFLKEYGVGEEYVRGESEEMDRVDNGKRNMTVADEDPAKRTPSPMPVTIVEHSLHNTSQGEVKWVTEFFNSGTARDLRIPAHIIEEMVAAGFKKYTILHVMRTHTHKLELANYLATILRISHVERDVIAGLIMERKGQSFHELKGEMK